MRTCAQRPSASNCAALARDDSKRPSPVADVPAVFGYRVSGSVDGRIPSDRPLLLFRELLADLGQYIVVIDIREVGRLEIGLAPPGARRQWTTAGLRSV